MFLSDEHYHFFNLYRSRYLIKMIYEFIPFNEIIRLSGINSIVYKIINEKYSFKKLATTKNLLTSTQSPNCIFSKSSIDHLMQIIIQSTSPLSDNEYDYIVADFMQNKIHDSIEFEIKSYGIKSPLVFKKLSTTIIKNLSHYPSIKTLKIKNFSEYFDEINEESIIKGSGHLKLYHINNLTISSMDIKDNDQYEHVLSLFNYPVITELNFRDSISLNNCNVVGNFIDQCYNLQKLILIDNHINESFINIICNNIRLNCHFKSLSIIANTITSNAKIIKELLITYGTNRLFDKLEYSYNKLLTQENTPHKVNFLTEMHQIYFNDSNINQSMVGFKTSPVIINYMDELLNITPIDIQSLFTPKRQISLFGKKIFFKTNHFVYIISNYSFTFSYNELDLIREFDKLFITKYIIYLLEPDPKPYIMGIADILSIHKSIVKLHIICDQTNLFSDFFVYLKRKINEMKQKPNIIKLKIEHFFFVRDKICNEVLVPLTIMFPKLKEIKFNSCYYLRTNKATDYNLRYELKKTSLQRVLFNNGNIGYNQELIKSLNKANVQCFIENAITIKY